MPLLDKPLFCILSGRQEYLFVKRTEKNLRNSKGAKVIEGVMDSVYQKRLFIIFKNEGTLQSDDKYEDNIQKRMDTILTKRNIGKNKHNYSLLT